ncbi:hypothetical protein Tcan_16409 [Toxocara canis]|uniref:Uncharacterized protein n=1 Tax=Toxocara canis TaxID=6265 RepID=A0A0B2V4W2_TOXCA|nr:hypothetical protein Tcan_16409 [Toxocara canis]
MLKYAGEAASVESTWGADGRGPVFRKCWDQAMESRIMPSLSTGIAIAIQGKPRHRRFASQPHHIPIPMNAHRFINRFVMLDTMEDVELPEDGMLYRMSKSRRYSP